VLQGQEAPKEERGKTVLPKKAYKRIASGSSGYTILVIDDQEEILIPNKLLLEREGHQVITAASGREALSLFHPGHVHLVIVDYFMPGMSGEEVIKEIRKLDQDVQILLQTGYSGEKPPREMLRSLDIQGYHDKAAGPHHLLLWVDVALKASAQLKKVREMDQLKTQLLANVSHELRTPLNVILGYSRLLLRNGSEPLPPQARQAIEAIERQAHTLGSLVSNFLNFATLEAQAMGLAPQSIQLADFQEEIQELMGFLLRNKPVSFAWQVSPQLPLVWADRQKLLLIFHNLLANAAKFTERGEVCVLAAPNGSKEEVALRIKDTGVGIAPEHHEAIFELFRQVDGSLTRRFGGTGVGLALARKLARMMGGEIFVESGVGAGACFTLKLRVSPETSSAYQAPLPPAIQPQLQTPVSLTSIPQRMPASL
jgi:signal transduction histidine kinase